MGGLCDSLHFWLLNLRACSRPICIVHGNDFGDVHALRLMREPRKCDSPKWEEWGGAGRSLATSLIFLDPCIGWPCLWGLHVLLDAIV